MRRRLFLVGFVLLASACGDSPTAPSSPPPPPQPAQMAGNWSGTFESQNYTPEVFAMNIVQTGADVRGTYELPNPRASGIIQGTATSATITGTLTFNIGNACAAAGTFSGSASSTVIRWESVGLTGPCSIALPVRIVINAQRR